MPGSITQVSALVEVQVKIEDWPVYIVAGLALILTEGTESEYIL